MKAFTLTNTGSTTANYNLSVVANGSQRGAGIIVSPSSVSVAAGTTMTVQVSVSMSAAAFAALPSDDTFTVGPGGVISVRGDILATPASGDPADHQTLRLPYMFVPRGLSNVVAGTPGPWAGTGQTFSSSLPLANSGLHAGTADLYTWGITDPNESGQPMDVRDVGVQVLPGSAFGVADTDRGLVFLINTWGQATNQSVNEFDVLVDTNRDGIPDFIVVGFDLGAVLTGVNNGQYASFTINASTGAIVDAFFADAPMNGSTIELPTLASDLGLAGKANGIGPVKQQGSIYSVNAFSLVPGGFVDTTGSASINPYAPPVSSGDFATIASGGSASFTLSIDQDQAKKTPALGWLVASVDDANGAAQAAEVPAPPK
jgi:hypothetical protein